MTILGLAKVSYRPIVMEAYDFWSKEVIFRPDQ